MHNYSAAKRKTTEEQASDVPQSKKHQLCNAPDVLCLKVFPLRKKCCQGIRGKPGQTTVASIKTWRVSPAEPPWPLTAAEANTHWEQCAMIISQKSQEKEDREEREGGACIFICPRVSLGLHQTSASPRLCAKRINKLRQPVRSILLPLIN